MSPFHWGPKKKVITINLRTVSLTEPQETEIYFSVIKASFFDVLSQSYPEFPRQVAVLWTLNKISRGKCLRSKALARNFFRATREEAMREEVTKKVRQVFYRTID
jgi:hypothetical protein